MTCHKTAMWVATYPDGDKRYICFGCAVKADLDGVELKLEELGYGERHPVCCAREEEPITLGDEDGNVTIENWDIRLLEDALTRIEVLEAALVEIRDLARTGLPPDCIDEQYWRQHKLNQISGEADYVLRKGEAQNK